MWMTRLTVEVETRLTAVERLNYFSTVKPEKARYTKDEKLLNILQKKGNIDNENATNWPNKGEIKINKLQLRYRNDVPLILKDIELLSISM